MKKITLLLALAAGFAVLPSAQAKDKAPVHETKPDESPEVTAAKQAVKDAEKELRAAKPAGKKAAQEKLVAAQKALRDAKKAAKPAAPETK